MAQGFPAYFLAIGERLASDHAAGIDAQSDAAKRALGSRLILTGQRSDVPGLLAAMDVFTLPSWREGMPRTIIEAMLMAKPVVATNIRGSREEVVDGETGLLVPVRDAAALAQAFIKLIGVGLDLLEAVPHTLDQTLAHLGRGDTACGARQQAKAQSCFQSSNRVTQG